MKKMMEQSDKLDYDLSSNTASRTDNDRLKKYYTRIAKDIDIIWQ